MKRKAENPQQEERTKKQSTAATEPAKPTMKEAELAARAQAALHPDSETHFVDAYSQHAQEVFVFSQRTEEQDPYIAKADELTADPGPPPASKYGIVRGRLVSMEQSLWAANKLVTDVLAASPAVAAAVMAWLMVRKAAREEGDRGNEVVPTPAPAAPATTDHVLEAMPETPVVVHQVLDLQDSATATGGADTPGTEKRRKTAWTMASRTVEANEAGYHAERGVDPETSYGAVASRADKDGVGDLAAFQRILHSTPNPMAQAALEATLGQPGDVHLPDRTRKDTLQSHRAFLTAAAEGEDIKKYVPLLPPKRLQTVLRGRGALNGAKEDLEGSESNLRTMVPVLNSAKDIGDTLARARELTNKARLPVALMTEDAGLKSGRFAKNPEEHKAESYSLLKKDATGVSRLVPKQPFKETWTGWIRRQEMLSLAEDVRALTGASLANGAGLLDSTWATLGSNRAWDPDGLGAEAGRVLKENALFAQAAFKRATEFLVRDAQADAAAAAKTAANEIKKEAQVSLEANLKANAKRMGALGTWPGTVLQAETLVAETKELTRPRTAEEALTSLSENIKTGRRTGGGHSVPAVRSHANPQQQQTSRGGLGRGRGRRPNMAPGRGVRSWSSIKDTQSYVGDQEVVDAVNFSGELRSPNQGQWTAEHSPGQHEQGRQVGLVRREGMDGTQCGQTGQEWVEGEAAAGLRPAQTPFEWAVERPYGSEEEGVGANPDGGTENGAHPGRDDSAGGAEGSKGRGSGMGIQTPGNPEAEQQRRVPIDREHEGIIPHRLARAATFQAPFDWDADRQCSQRRPDMGAQGGRFAERLLPSSLGGGSKAMDGDAVEGTVVHVQHAGNGGQLQPCVLPENHRAPAGSGGQPGSLLPRVPRRHILLGAAGGHRKGAGLGERQRSGISPGQGLGPSSRKRSRSGIHRVDSEGDGGLLTGGESIHTEERASSAGVEQTTRNELAPSTDGQVSGPCSPLEHLDQDAATGTTTASGDGPGMGDGVEGGNVGASEEGGGRMDEAHGGGGLMVQEPTRETETNGGGQNGRFSDSLWSLLVSARGRKHGVEGSHDDGGATGEPRVPHDQARTTSLCRGPEEVGKPVERTGREICDRQHSDQGSYQPLGIAITGDGDDADGDGCVEEAVQSRTDGGIRPGHPIHYSTSGTCI